ncbi:putative F-box domain, kelch-type beta propeller, F-box-like domain superfamily [Helianthus annuus]|uniref:F-box domain, kelch-type beta propeller, F-box-like domain superfamily n=1 Tax=Helianthus annuus TaxID=4232 RepID=A0A251VSC9_HELAN|nr:F-box/kelch-repeat protein At2g44130 [Helianthus annuus]KAF5823308.1 putative F-box domain, kelch-type beta propeller, F-box-like domain superfamily [Helianthus annuus]KAJ0612673.1 putative F-box/kelch-repeat protein KMD1/2 [Helianthus annuus]KAJ0628037.1 putative F-box/kelch-repeat protein KMD1/2 [Helianthus annuus]KAJ0784329.1 putative F-box/kelch-repeat protein KMD1/2 [Helianthus annuus]KAJ0958121.1 putative F-box domain, kelch-type beta propeller, F-box-like domain superfamily [Helianth
MEPQPELELTELIPGLPEEIALECLTRLHYDTHAVASDVCRRWRHLLQDRSFYYHRKKSGLTRRTACFVQALPVEPEPGRSEAKPEKQPKYGLSVFDPATNNWDQIDPVPKYPNGLPLFCQVASTEGKLVVMGGWNPVNWEPLRDVFVYEFTTRRWTQRVDMPSTRSFFAAGACDGKVYVAGGHDESKNALRSAWVYNIALDEWTELTRMSEERDECEGVMIGSEFWVVSGYDTDSQGRFKDDAEVLDIVAGTWRRVEGVWGESRCPRSCVAVGQNGNFISWGAYEPEVQVGTCGVDLGDCVLVTGSVYQSAPLAVYVVEKTNQGQNGKSTKIDIPNEFSGFVQSGCLVEI